MGSMTKNDMGIVRRFSPSCVLLKLLEVYVLFLWEEVASHFTV